jgi:outer membrane protein assembly factor BamE (lipoprotein component of BamABCDE complex)
MKRITIFFSVVFVLLSMACASVGQKFNIEAAKENIKIGTSTKEQVLQICGEPLSKNSQSDMEVWHYSYIEKNVTGVGIITNIVGVGTEWKTNRQIMDVFLKNGIVTDIKTDSAEGTTMHYK